MKKKHSVIIILALLLSAFISGTLAFLGYQAFLNNSLSIAYNEIELINTNEVKIKNTGTVDCYVRLFCELSYPTDGYVTVDGNNIDIDDFWQGTGIPENWEYISSGDLEGYFYYTEELSPGETTNNLFDSIEILDSDSELLTFAESMQIRNSNGELYSDYETAWLDFLGGVL